MIESGVPLKNVLGEIISVAIYYQCITNLLPVQYHIVTVLTPISLSFRFWFYKTKTTDRSGLEVQACNLRYWGGRGRRNTSSRPAWAS